MLKIESITLRNFKSFKRAKIPFSTGFNAITGPNGSGKCVKGDTLIQLVGNEPLEIKKIVDEAKKKGERKPLPGGFFYYWKESPYKILTFNPATNSLCKSKLSFFVEKMNNGEILEIETIKGRKIETTSDHPVLVIQNHISKFLEARSLEEGIKILSYVEKNGKLEIDIIKKINYFQEKGKVYDLFIPFTHNFVGNNIFIHNSNIIEAINFTLGVRSSKNLRAENLTQLICNKLKKKKAKVSLKLKGEGEEIEISREISNKGQSVYRLNGKRATRTVVMDMLARYGLQPSGHNIVLQGDVTKIVKMKPVERRGIIDEISGIGEYEEKKERALKKLGETLQKLQEIKIIIDEKRRIVENLEKEIEKMKKYFELEERRKHLEDSILVSRFRSLNEKKASIENKIKNHTKTNYDEELIKIREEIREKTADIERIEKKLIEETETIRYENLKSNLKVKKAQLKANEAEIKRLNTLLDKFKPKAAIHLKNLPGVYGLLSELIKPKQGYEKAVESSAGSKLNLIVVDTFETAKKCIEILTKGKVGRARFIPLDTVKTKKPPPPQSRSLGLIKDFIQYDEKFRKVIDYVFGGTLLVNDIRKLRRSEIGKYRVVDLNGNLVEKDGVVFGGYVKKTVFQKGTKVEDEIKHFEKENLKLEKEINELNKKLLEMGNQWMNFEELRIKRKKLKEHLKKLREEEDRVFRESIWSKKQLEQLKINFAVVNSELEGLKKEVESKGLRLDLFGDIDENKAKMEIETLEKLIAQLGKLNFRAEEEYFSFKKELDDLESKYQKVLEERERILDLINKIEKKKKEVFKKTLEKVSANFNFVFNKLTGGEGKLRLEDEKEIESGLVIEVKLPEKKIVNIDALSGGEKTLTALAFILAIQKFKPSPFYVFDEVDSSLDVLNCKKFAKLLKEESRKTQFILASLKKETLAEADQLVGVTMKDGLSQVVMLRLKK